MARRTTKPVHLSGLLVQVLDEMRLELRDMGYDDSYPAASELLAVTLKAMTREALESALELRRALYGGNGNGHADPNRGSRPRRAH